jgi:alpha-beta hydrolase superfamily lysophospholipase
MSANSRNDTTFGPAAGLAEALYFDSGDHRLFGWLHRPTEATLARIGLVICKPFGYESICSHRSVRAFAEAAAAIGVPSLRFDYLGTGDSADIAPQADQVEIWSQDVVAAVQELRQQTGVDRVCLLGFRLGALLATLAATQCKVVSALILIAPIIKGRRYLRELHTTRLAATLGAAVSTSSPPDDIPVATAGSIEVSGFALSPATVATLSQVDLTTLRPPPVTKMLIMDGNGLPVARAWAELLPAQGVQTEYQVLPGLVEMLMTAPQFTIIPQAMVTAMCEWLQRFQHGPSTPAEASRRQYLNGGVVPATNVLQLPSEGPEPNAVVTERPLFFGSDALLFGIVTEPFPGELRRRAVILLNAGADYHIGANRMYVPLARQWARHGYVALRMDLRGIGDSGTIPGRPDNEVFPPAALDDIRAAIEFMRTRYGAVDITLGGLCSGGYHALRAAAAAVPVNRIFLINPQNFFWKAGMTIDQLQLAEVVRNPAIYRERVLSAMAWKRLLTGRVNIWRIVQVYVQRYLLAMESTFRDMTRRLGIRLSNDLGWELEEIGARAVQVIFVFGRGEPGIDLLKLQGGSSVKRLGEKCRIHIIDPADHIFSQSASRAMLEGILSGELYARNQWRADSG